MAAYSSRDKDFTITCNVELKDLLEATDKAKKELKELSDSGTKASKGIDKLESSAKSAGGALGKLTTIAKAVSAALVSSQVIAYAQSWNELEDRIQNTGATASQTKDILDQLLATSDRNGRTIEESSELYIRLSNSMSELGYSTQSTLSYIDTLSNLMTINKTSAIGAESAINALTKAQMKGKLAGIEAMSVFNAMPSVLGTLSNYLKKNAKSTKEAEKITEQYVRQLATDGKLSMQTFTDAMIAAQEETAALADNMRNTVTDGINRVTNNLKKYLGELNNSTGATKVLVDSLILMSQHVDILMTGVGALAAIYAGKYITSLASATKQSAEQTIANIRQAQAEKVLIQAEMARINENIRALEVQKQNIILAQTHCNSLRAQTSLNKQLIAVEAQLATATNKHAVAQTQLNTAIKTTSLAANGLRSAMALLGGPAGAAMLAAMSLYYFYEKAKNAKEEAVGLTGKVKALSEQLNSFADEKLVVIKDEAVKDIKNAQEQLKLLRVQMKSTQDLLDKKTLVPPSEKQINEALVTRNKQREQEKEILDGIFAAQKQIAEVEDILASRIGPKLVNNGKELAKNWDDASKSKIDKKLASISKELEIAKLKAKENSEAAFVLDGLYSALGDSANEYREDLVALALGQTNFTKLTNDQVAALQPLLAQLKALSVENNKIKSSNKKGTTKSYAEEVKELSDKLAVAKLEAQGLTVEAELLAITQKMGGKVTAEQTKKLKELIEISQAYKNLGSLKSPLEIEEDSFKQSKKLLDTLLNDGAIKTQEEYNSKLEELERQHQINMAKIKSDSVVSKIDDAIAQVDPAQALKNENDRKLALIQEFEKQKWITEENAIALREAANHQYEQNRINAQWEIWRNQSDANEFLASSLEGLASSATSTISGLASGTMTATQAMQNFANVILNEAIGSLVQMGMQYVKNAIVAKTTSASTTAAQILEAQALAAAYQPAAMYASIATQGAAAITGATSYATAIGSMKALGIAYGGGRLRGGGVDVGKAYRVNESGEPELFVAHGKQYMIPNKNGEVIPSNKLSRGSAGKTIINNITQNISFGDGQDNKEAANETARMLRHALRSVIQEEQRPGGLLNRR
jgi:tape measure domain-containing protein